jgi:opacity protein-like surface antigen
VVNGDVEAHSINIAGVYTYPIDVNFSLFGKVGVIDARVKTSLNATGVGRSASASTSKTSVRPTIGFGATYNVM